MKPGATARPAASMVVVALPEKLPTATILPSAMATSPLNGAPPDPSTIRPLLIRISACAIPVSPTLLPYGHRR